jgi:hypothetical protein
MEACLMLHDAIQPSLTIFSQDLFALLALVSIIDIEIAYLELSSHYLTFGLRTLHSLPLGKGLPVGLMSGTFWAYSILGYFS